MNKSKSKDDLELESVEVQFAKVLNRHGYGFQYSVIQKLYELNRTGKSNFIFQTVEFPVEIHGVGTRIDFILTKRANDRPPFFVLVECKRANPRLSNWCFVKAPYTNRKSSGKSEPVYMEHIELHGSDSSAFAKPRSYVDDVYHIGIEVRANATGDSGGESGRAIEDAASQVLRGLNGYVQTIFSNRQLLGSFKNADLLPVIFTTAQLYTSSANLTNANIETGNIDLEGSIMQRVPFLFYQYNLSPGIKHLYSPQYRPADLSDLIATEYIRTIPIVNSEGTEAFINWLKDDLDLDN